MLDIIRISAAAVVAFGHLTRSPFSTGWADYTYLAREAVSVFFILSGFVIRYVTCRRRTTLAHYLGDRASRIYSIAIPALLLTWIADTIARHVNPVAFQPFVLDANHPLLRVLVNLLFCGQLWTFGVNPGSDSAFWSVNYEVAYYLIYGCAFYLAGGKRWFWVIALCLFFGPRVVYLAPLWFLGWLAHDLYQRWTAAGTVTLWLNWLLLIPAIAFGAVFLESSAHPGLTGISVLSVWPHLDRMANSVGVRPPEYVFGFLWCILFMRLLLFARGITLSEDSRLVRSVRFISEGTFPIYLTHFPLYVLIAACVPYNHGDPLAKILIFIVVMIFGIFAGHPGNLFKNKIRSLLFSDHSRTA